MMKFIMLFLISLNSIENYGHETKNKIVGLVAIRNEARFIEQCLRALSLYCDAIVILDDASTDNSLEIIEKIAKEVKVEKVVKKTKWFRDEPGDKNLMLQAGREVGGTHFIIIDADEMLSATCLDDDFLRKSILNLEPGEALYITFYNLWRSPKYYRNDGSQWSPYLIGCAFFDNKTCYFDSDFIHTPRIPQGLIEKSTHINDGVHGLMHFQFINWENLLIKQAWYRCLERIRKPEKPISLINYIYGCSKDEANLGLTPVPKNWLKKYSFYDKSSFKIIDQTRKEEVLSWFDQYGQSYFKQLDIWDVDWLS